MSHGWKNVFELRRRGKVVIKNDDTHHQERGLVSVYVLDPEKKAVFFQQSGF